MFDNAIEILEFSKVLNIIAQNATSEPGAEKVKSLFPRTDYEMILLELNRVKDMVTLCEKGEIPPFKGIYDLSHPLKTASVAGAMLSPESLNRVCATVGCARMVKRFLFDRARIAGLLADMSNRMNTFEELENAVNHCIDEVNEVRDTASQELKRIRGAISIEKSKARAALARLLKEWNDRGYLQEEVIASRDGRLTLPVKGGSRGKVKGLLVDQSSTGSTVFIEPLETVEINNAIRQLELEERREIDRILRELTAIVYKYHLEIEETTEVLLEIDCLFARAQYAGKYDCFQPEINFNNRIHIIDGRHPLLLIKEKKVVPLNLELDEGTRTLVISGPNAGGKTVSLKTVGLLTLMGLSGCWVPAKKGTILPQVKEMHAIIGDNQSIAADLSTFSSHLTRLTDVVKSSEKHKMALIDEIMTGTDPAEGTALAIALLERLTRDGALTLCTTHKGDLKAFAQQAEGVVNGSLEFDPGSLSPTYRFLIGIPGSSYAFSLAKKVGLPDEVIARAEELRGSDRGALERLLLELTEKMSEAEKLRMEAAASEAKAESLRNQLETELRNAKSIEKKLVEKAEAEAEKILADAHRVIEKAIREVRDKGASKEAVKTAQALASEAQASFDERRKAKRKAQPPRKQEPIVIGDRVRLEDSETTGIVVEGKNNKGRVLVETKGVRIWMDEALLIKLPPLNEKDKPRKIAVHYEISSQAVSPKIDLRGLDSQQAIIQLEEYLVQASTANFEKVEIVHGKGNGVLRKVVWDLLKTSPLIKSCKIGEWGQGDYGVTMAELRG